MVNLEIKFIMDGTGIYYMPHEGIMIDSLLMGCLMPKNMQKTLMKSDIPDEIDLPLKKHKNNYYHASSLFPDKIQGESLQYWRKRFRQNRIEMIRKNVETTMGTYRDYNVPMPLIICREMVGYAVGDRDIVEKEFKKIKHLGSKRAYGKGAIVDLEINEIKEDWSIKKDGRYMRFISNENGDRYGRIRPPYWNNNKRILTNFIGDKCQ